MQQLIYFFRKYRYFLFFLLLQIVALGLTINNHNFHKSKFISSSNLMTGGFYNKVSSITDYFHLDKENSALVQENSRLKNRLNQLLALANEKNEKTIIDSLKYKQQYTFVSGKIINNKFSSDYNFLTINLGQSDSINSEMAVINDLGIIGITENTSKNYSRVQSILNKDSKINARLKNSFYFGTLTWDGIYYNTVQLMDIPRQAIINPGDTIITGGRSAIFPEGILIGKVLNIEEESPNVSKVIHIQLFNDMSNLKNIYVIKNFFKSEIDSLENNSNE